MNIALLHNPRPSQPPADFPDDAFEEYDGDATIAGIAASLRRLDVNVEPIVADSHLPWRLTEHHFDFVFNMAEGAGRRCREAIPAAICELLGLPFTGSDALTLAIALDKFIAKRVVAPDVPVARGVLVDAISHEARLESLRFPVIVKPNDEGSSKGIRENPVCTTVKAAMQRVAWLQSRYGCPVLIEEFLAGPELTVAVVGNSPNVRVLGVMEIAPKDTTDEAFVYSLEVKRDWQRRVTYHVPPRVDPRIIQSVCDYALASYRLLGCRDISRIDFRLDEHGTPHFMECNPLPGLDPITSDVVMLSKHQVSYDDVIQGILRDAMQRTGVSLR